MTAEIEALALAITVRSIFGFLIFMIVLLVLVFFINRVVWGSRSERYRKMITDLYVVGKIRLLANKDGIDLKEELKELVKTIKEYRKYTQPLDRTIEEELQERVVKEGQESGTKSKEN